MPNAFDNHRRLNRAAFALAGSLLAFGCGEAAGPDGPASIAVTSPVDTILALGKATQLSATARDAQGNPVGGTSFTWQSSNPTVVSVTGSGAASAQGVGNATVTASAGQVSGTIRLRVVDADLATVTTLAGDAFVAAMVAALTTSTRSAVQTALAGCVAAATTGNIVALAACIAEVGAEAASSTDGTDRALLAVLALFADEIERRLGL